MVSPRALKFCTILAILIIWLLSPRAIHADDAEALRHFETRIRPVLVQHCYSCHSLEAQASGKLKGGLLLDSRQGLLAGGDSAPAVTPEAPQDSLLLAALKHEDFEMPPSGKLADTVIDDFSWWITHGAVDPREGGEVLARAEIDFEAGRTFWAFQPPRVVEPPEITNPVWAINDLDRFVMARLEREDLTPVPPASPQQLLRRATYDLTGLPPTPKETGDFLSALESTTTREAYSAVVDRLLSSNHYGERWGRHWLDVARYAEDQAHTFGVSRRAHAHEYRDWVIKAFNDDMPYDRFIKMQLAGDLIDDDTIPPRERLAGLGILGLGAIYYKNSDKAQAQADELDDRIDTVTRGLLGLTVSCARCHDHKFDPIPTQDYYSLAGIFHNTRMVDKPLAPQHVVEAYKTAEKTVKQAEDRAKDYRNQRKSELAESKRHSVANYMSAVWQYRQRKAKDGSAKLETLADELALEKAWIDRWHKFLDSKNKYINTVPSLKAWLALPQPDGTGDGLPATVTTATKAFEAHLNHCLDERDGKLATGNGRPIFTSQTVDRKTPLIDIEVDLQNAERLFLVVTDSGDGTNSDWADWLNPRLTEGNNETSLLDLEWINSSSAHHSVHKNLNCDGKPLKVAGKTFQTGIGTHSLSIIEYKLPTGFSHFRAQGGLDGSGEGSVQFRVYTERPTDVQPAKESPERRARKELIKRVFSPSGLFAVNDKELKTHITPTQATELEQLELQVADAKAKLPDPLPMAHIVQDTGTKNLKVYLRGDPARQGDEAPRRFLRILAGDDRLAYEEGSGRLALAEDIASAQNPLTARVIVNRVWQHHFGRGLVSTPSNFGTQGARPTHPELLDSLAVQFMDSGWSLKWLHRKIMLSATYQLSSTHQPEAEAIDPENFLLWRMNRRRLEVESWRDALLYVSGTLDKTTGGPTVKLSDTNNHRRTVYGAISRHELDGLLRLFDFPDANVTSATRTETTVPQQQLFVLNSDFFVTQSKALAARLEQEAGDNEVAKIQHAYRLLFGREPDSSELRIARSFVNQSEVPSAKLNRWEQYSQALLGSNEFLYID